MHFGQAGLLALPSWVTAPLLAFWVQEARDFAAEWVELRPLYQNKLCGRCLRAPLQAKFLPLPNASCDCGSTFLIRRCISPHV